VHRTLGWMIALLAFGASAGAASAQVVKHSGTVALVDTRGGKLVLDEVGPWKTLQDGTTVVTKRIIIVTPETEMVVVRRQATEWYPAEFITLPLVREVAPGDFVTVECRHDGPRMTALQIVVVEPESP
jgi:hypothetical protein